MSVLEVAVEVTPRPTVAVEVDSPRPVPVERPDGIRIVYGVTQGPQGAVGPAGGTGYEHVQASPAATWSITHGLGRYPRNAELVIDGRVAFTDVEYPDTFTAVVTFASPQSGILRLI